MRLKHILGIAFAFSYVVNLAFQVHGVFDPVDPYEELRYTAVLDQVDGLIDVPQVRQIIGDRPIVVMATPDTVYGCYGMISRFPGLIGLVLADQGQSITDDESFDTCDNENPHYDATQRGYEFLRWTPFRGDRTALVAEYVRIYDAQVEAAGPGQPHPRRDAPPPRDDGPDPVQIAKIALLVGIIGGLVLFAAKVTRELWRGARWQSARTRTWRAETDARLNALADTVLHPTGPPTEHRAEIAKHYVLALREFESIRTSDQATNLNRMLDDLETTTHLPEPPPPPRPKQRQPPQRQKRAQRRRRKPRRT